MTGLNKILDRIAQDSQEKCDAILLEAKEEADKIRVAAATKDQAETAAIVDKANKEAAQMIGMANSGSEQEIKKQLLATKVHILDKAIDAAVEKLKKLPDTAYFETLYKLVKHYAQDADAIMYLGKADLNRLPADFSQKVNEVGKGTIQVAAEPRDIADGFILAYGEIEINCTFEALVEESHDDIKDELYQIIFA